MERSLGLSAIAPLQDLLNLGGKSFRRLSLRCIWITAMNKPAMSALSPASSAARSKLSDRHELIGLQLGPGFFASVRKRGMQLNAIAACVVLLGAALAIALGWLLEIDFAGRCWREAVSWYGATGPVDLDSHCLAYCFPRRERHLRHDQRLLGAGTIPDSAAGRLELCRGYQPSGFCNAGRRRFEL
jgi:hypothetical protein